MRRLDHDRTNVGGSLSFRRADRSFGHGQGSEGHGAGGSGAGGDKYEKVHVPITLCLLILSAYVTGGGWVFSNWENWSRIEGKCNPNLFRTIV